MVEQPASVVNVGSSNITGRNISNAGNTYNLMGGADDLLRALRQLVVPEAMHDSKEVDKEGTCHPGTRVIVLEDVAAWVEHLDPEFTIKWMKGAAGAGKSAIARTVAKLLAKDGLLLASFFCWRSSEGRSDGSRVIPTLVDQIITRIPAVRPVIEEAFRQDPHLLKKSFEIQAIRLIVEPLASIPRAQRRSLPRVIIIDGLDEIKGGEAQCDILKAIAFLIDNLPSTIHFFITSRPEHQIQDYFTQSMEGKWSAVSLDNTYHPDRDILIYYKAHFSLIVAAFPTFKLEPDWPGEEIRRKLVAKGLGQFVFAAIVIRFVGNRSISISPRERLEKILENVSDDEHNPLKLLDLVYVTVFQAIPDDELKDVLQLVGLVLLPHDFKKSPRVIDAVLFLEPGTTENRLRYLHSVLKAPSPPEEAITPLHATLGDFVFSKSRSHSFGLYVNQNEFHQAVILKIMKESIVPLATEQLMDCRHDWIDTLYQPPISHIFINDSTFRSTLASHVAELQRSDITQWSALALMKTYPVVLEALILCSSWFNIKDKLSWRILERKRQKEVLRRLQSYATIGPTGHILFFIQGIHNCRLQPRCRAGLEVCLKALPDQNFVATQNVTGLALPFDRFHLDHPNKRKVYSMFAEPFVDPTFVETFFTLAPWDDSDRLLSCDLYFAFSEVFDCTGCHEEYFVRLLSLRNLPQVNPCWSDMAKGRFNELLGVILDREAESKAGIGNGPKYEAAKKKILERVAAL